MFSEIKIQKLIKLELPKIVHEKSLDLFIN